MKPIRQLTYHAFALLVFASLALSPHTRAGCQEGCGANDNTFLGNDALINLTTGVDNTAVGDSTLTTNTTGSYNTASGSQALLNNTIGTYDTAIGAFALRSNTAGAFNTAIGTSALQNNAGSVNTAVGVDALTNNETGSQNTAVGVDALGFNRNGILNTAIGYSALESNSSGYYNTAIGADALLFNTTGNFNIAIGLDALDRNTTGSDNTATGLYALRLSNGSSNTADGYRALFTSTGNNNIAVGYDAGRNLTSGNQNIYMGNSGVTAESNTIRIGRTGQQIATYIAGINGETISDGIGVIIDSNGHLGTTTSSERYKQDIEPMDKASEAILNLKPVTFRYKKELDPNAIPQFGLVAEQVEKVNPALVARDGDGKPYSVRYEAVNAMLLNEFLKEHRTVKGQQKTISELESAVARQRKEIKGLITGLRKVSNQVELAKVVTRAIVANNSVGTDIRH